MSHSTFPIVEVDGNRAISKNGNIGYFYKVETPDFEQLCDVQKNSFFERLSKSLNSLPVLYYYKFYRIEDSFYLETNCETIPELSNLLITPQKDPLKVFFGDNQIISDIGIYNDYLSYNGKYIRLMSTIGFSEEDINDLFIPDGVDYVLITKRLSNEKSLTKLEKIRTGHLSSFTKSKRDISSEGAYEQAEELISDIIHGNESLFEIELYFLLKENTVKELNNVTQLFYSEMNNLGIKTFIEGQSLRHRKTGLASLFNDLIPAVKPSLSMRMIPNKTSHLRYLLPLHRSSLTRSGIKFHDIADNEIYFDLFLKKFKNRNMLVTGMSGTGKSVFVNKLLMNLAHKHPTVILDMGGSYKRLSLYHAGTELKEGFNPFHFKDPIYIREIILSVADDTYFNNLQKGKLLARIRNELPNSKNFFELLENLEQEFKGITYLFEEIREYITNEPLTFQKILYVDIENLPKAIISPMIIYILEYFKNIEESEKILVFDECWEYLEDHAHFVSRCFRTFRKTGAFTAAISQGLIDFKGMKESEQKLFTAITNNSYFTVYFPQELNSDLGLSNFDIDRINSLEFEKSIFSECYLKTKDESIRKIIRNYLTPLELEITHTENGEDEPLLNFIENFGSFFKTNAKAIESFVRLKYEDIDNYNLITSIN